jgi:uncharacterized protein (DUF1800 family)
MTTANRAAHPSSGEARGAARPDDPARRAFVRGLTVASASPSLLLAACATTGNDVAVPSDPATAYRLANRISWGATDAELQRVRQKGAAAYIDQQLRATAGNTLPAPVQAQIDVLRIQTTSLQTLVWETEASRKSIDAVGTEEGRKAAQQAYQQELNKLAREAASRHLLRALYSPNQLQEQMTWFWFNHFNVHQYKGNVRAMLGDYEERAIRPHALGRFRDLLGAVAHHPAMLRYLDNEQNAAGRPNENYARELLELHTLGVDSGYTQRDVQELARVLSGHGVNLTDNTPRLRRELTAQYVRDGLYEFNPNRHDFGTKNLLTLTIRGSGATELDEVLDALAVHPSTARFVSRKMAKHLLADEPPARVVDAMVDAWGRSQGQIAAVLGVLLRAPEFSAAATPSTPAKFKDPMHFVVSAVRACYGERIVLNTGPMQNWLNRLGQGLYNRQTPDGYPSNEASWSSSGQMATRFEIARALGSGSAGLFKTDDPMAPREQPAFPQLSKPIYYEAIRPQLAASTRDALDSAASPQDWNSLYLSSPEFMYS